MRIFSRVQLRELRALRGFILRLGRFLGIRLRHGLVLLAVLAVPAGAAEKPLPDAVTAAELLDLLRERSPRTAAERAAVGVAESDIVAAGLLPNPEVSYQGYGALAGTNTIDGSQHTFVVGQPLLIAGQRGARRAAAKRRLEALSASVDASFADRARAARLLFVALLAEQERVARLDEQRARLVEVERIVAGRASAGAMSRYDLARIGVERAALEARLAESRTDLDDASLGLATLLGVPGWRPRAVGTLGPGEIGADAERLWAEAERALPALEAARRSEAAARSEIEVARRERWPVPVLSAGPYATSDPESYSAVVGLSMAVPLFDRGQAALQRVRAEARAAELTRAAVAAEARAALGRAADVLASRRVALEEFERDVVSQLPGLRRMAEEAYRLGQSGILDLLDVVRSETDLRLEHVERLAAVSEAEVETLAAAGRVEDMSAGGALRR